MKKLCIIGSYISGLYSAIKYIDCNNLEINIIEKKCEIVNHNSNNDDYIYNLYNDNHLNYINLLKKFNIESINLDIKFNDKLYAMINYVIEKSKLLPYNIYLSYSFINLCKNFLNNIDFEYIQKELNINNILNYINACDFINFFNDDLSKKVKYYYVTNNNINLLISRMIETIKQSNINFLYNTKINNINYDNNIFILNNNKNLKYDYIICTLSKKNLLELKLWNNKHLNILNTVTNINKVNVKNLIDNFININIDTNIIENNNIIRNLILDKLHVSYPQKKYKNNKLAVWNTLDNKIINDNNNIFLLKQKIKFIYNNKFFICSTSYSKNNFFINYLIESIDETSFIKNKNKKKK